MAPSKTRRSESSPARLLFGQGAIWPYITKLAKSSEKVHVAVAYFGAGGRNLLPLPRGSVLVVDASDASVRAGRTCPRALLALQRRGVRVFSRKSLHAKVFIFDGTAVVGSTNASLSSAYDLEEAALVTREPAAVAACRRYVESLTDAPLGPRHLGLLAGKYRPPKFGRRRSPPHVVADKKRERVGQYPTTWIAPLVTGTWDERDYAENRQARGAARSQISDENKFRLEEFRWNGATSRRFRIGHDVVQSVTEGKDIRLYPPGKVVYLHRYSEKGHRRVIVYIEVPKWRKSIAREKVLRRLGRGGQTFCKGVLKRLSDSVLHKDFRALWKG